jgi:hypothetical protein
MVDAEAGRQGESTGMHRRAGAHPRTARDESATKNRSRNIGGMRGTEPVCAPKHERDSRLGMWIHAAHRLG